MRKNLSAAFDHALRTYANNIAIEYADTAVTYAQLDRWADGVAHQLHRLGVRAGDVVAIYMHNHPRFFAVDIAIARLGAVKLPLNYMLPVATISHILRVSDVRVVIAGTELLDSARAALLDAPDAVLVEATDGVEGSVAGGEILASQNHDVDNSVRSSVESSAPAALYFTGGTTGLPKGVVHTQASTVSFHYAQLLEAEIHQDERLLLMTPLAHAAGLFGQSALIRGATIVLTDGFDVPETVRLLTERGITWTFLVPTMIYRLLDAIDTGGHGLTLRTIVYGAAPISPSRLREALEIFGPVFVQLYGQTESPNWGTRLAKQDHDLERPDLLGSCGQASLLADLKIVDDDGNEAAAGTSGEICLRTPYLLDHYLGNPAATAEKFLGDWIRTGDIGVIDANGYLYLLDRKSDMVISGGMNVYCKEVEDVLTTHPAVDNAAVIGVPHSDWGEAVHAVIVLSDDSVAADDILAWSRDRLAAYARPKSIETVTALPETPFGKIDKKVLRAPHWAREKRAIG